MHENKFCYCFGVTHVLLCYQEDKTAFTVKESAGADREFKFVDDTNGSQFWIDLINSSIAFAVWSGVYLNSNAESGVWLVRPPTAFILSRMILLCFCGLGGWKLLLCPPLVFLLYSNFYRAPALQPIELISLYFIHIDQLVFHICHIYRNMEWFQVTKTQKTAASTNASLYYFAPLKH